MHVSIFPGFARLVANQGGILFQPSQNRVRMPNSQRREKPSKTMAVAGLSASLRIAAEQLNGIPHGFGRGSGIPRDLKRSGKKWMMEWLEPLFS
ncbi:MAG: hypothetical protein R3D29_01445 [Nitratireductor sp.]